MFSRIPVAADGDDLEGVVDQNVLRSGRFSIRSSTSVCSHHSLTHYEALMDMEKSLP